MHSQKKRKIKRRKKTSRKKSEPIGYQADNPLTIYYAKYIEKKPEVK